MWREMEGGRVNESVFPSLPIGVRSVIRGGQSVRSSCGLARAWVGRLRVRDVVIIGACLTEGVGDKRGGCSRIVALDESSSSGRVPESRRSP